MLAPAAGAATLEPGRVRLAPRENLLRSIRRGAVCTSELTRAGQWRLEPHIDLQSPTGETGLWDGVIAGPPVAITVR